MPRPSSLAKTCSSFAFLAAVGVASTAAATDDDVPVDFDLDVRPILSRTCFECHGPDAEARRAEVRVDTEDGLLGEFGVVLMVGGSIPQETRVVSIAIFEAVERHDYAAAHQLSALIVLVSYVVLMVVYGLNRRFPMVVR